MARTSKSRGVEPFSMRSGKGSTFKMMGSSPMLVGEEEKVTMGEEKIVGTSTTESEKSTDIKTDYRTKGKGYTPPTTTPEGDKAYAALTQVEKDAQDAKYKKRNTRDIVVDRSETKSTPKELTTQEKMAKGKHHSKYYDTKTKSYRVKQYDFKQLSSGKYTKTGRGKQSGDISLEEWRKTHGSVEDQKKSKKTVDSRGKTGTITL